MPQPYRQSVGRRARPGAVVIAGARGRRALVQRRVVFGLALCGIAECLLLLLRAAGGQ